MAMATAHFLSERLVPVEEYLGTSYRPDCDYVDGRIEERNFGEYEHSKIQRASSIGFWAIVRWSGALMSLSSAGCRLG